MDYPHQSIDSISTNAKEIKFCTLNVCGLHSKLENGYFDLFCSQYDILCFSETKACNFNFSQTLLHDYTVFSAEGSEDKLFATHGLCILVRQAFSKYFTVIHHASTHVLWLKVDKGLIGCEFIVGALYLPCESSKFYEPNVFESICDDISSFEFPVCILGDFNSRTGCLNDLFDNDDMPVHMYALDEAQQHYNVEYLLKNDAAITRLNEDKKKQIRWVKTSYKCVKF